MEQDSKREPIHDINWDQAFLTFIELVSCGTESSKLRATVEVSRLADRAPEHILVPVVRVLVELLDNSSPSLQEAAVLALHRVARRADGSLCPLIGHAGVVSSLLKLLHHASGGFRRVLVKTLRDVVAYDKTNQVILARNGGLEAVLELIPLSADRLRRHLLEILTMLTMLREARRALVNLGGLPCLVEAVWNGRMSSRARAAHAVGFLGTTMRVRHRLVNSGAVPALVELLREGDTQAKLTAANSLGIISSHKDYVRLVAEAGVIPLYAALLEGPEPLGREISEDVFCILAVVEENAVSISRQLVRILQEGNEEGKAAAADVIWDLASYKHSASVIRDSGAIQLLVDILRDGDGDVRERVSGAITQLSYGKVDRCIIADAGAIPVLIDLINGDSDELKENAAEALVNFSEDPLFRESLSEVLSVPAFLAVKDRLFSPRASNEYVTSSLRHMVLEFISDPDLM